MQTNKKAFTLVEMIVAMAVSTIIIAGAYASYDMVKTQYTKNLDLSQMQQSGRAIMQMIERDARMAGFEYLDEDANMTYGKISSPLTIKDSGNKCCDELTVIYDYEWAAVKAVEIKEEEKEKYPIPSKEGEFYEWRMDMTTEKRFSHENFMDALDYINIFSADEDSK